VGAATLSRGDRDFAAPPAHLAHDRAQLQVDALRVERAGERVDERRVSAVRPEGRRVGAALAAPFVERAERADARRIRRVVALDEE
jgi:hypothetical protein